MNEGPENIGRSLGVERGMITKDDTWEVHLDKDSYSESLQSACINLQST